MHRPIFATELAYNRSMHEAHLRPFRYMAKSPLGTKTRLSAVTWSIEEIFFSSVSHLTSRMSTFSRSHELAFGTSVLHQHISESPPVSLNCDTRR